MWKGMRCGVIVGNGEVEGPKRVVFEDMLGRVVGPYVRDKLRISALDLIL